MESWTCGRCGRLRGLIVCLHWQTNVVQIKLAALCSVKIHKCECLLVSGSLCALVSSTYLGPATAGFLGDRMYFLFFLTEVTGVSVFRGRVVAVLLGKSQITPVYCTQGCKCASQLIPSFWRGHKQAARGSRNLSAGKIPFQWIWTKFFWKGNSELSFFRVFSVPLLKTQAQHLFSMNPLTVPHLQTLSSPLTPDFRHIEVIGLERMWIWSARGSTCLMPMEGGTGCYGTRPPQEEGKCPGRWGVHPAGFPGCCTHPALGLRPEELAALPINAGKEVRAWELLYNP